MSIRSLDIPAATADGHAYRLIARIPAQPTASLLWLPALGVAARHYLPFADELAARGIAVLLHEMRGNGSSNLRAGREADWGYRQILSLDLPASETAMRQHCDAPVRIIGGHSIGGQLATCYLAMEPEAFARLWLVASGTPYWRTFPAPLRYLLPLVYQFTPWLAERRGALPGRTLGFGGEEARTLMRDWSRVGLSGRYAATGLDIDLEPALSRAAVQAQAILLDRDWFVPTRSMEALLEKLPRSHATLTTLDSKALGARADHFAWMKQPAAVVHALLQAERQSAT